MLFTIQSILVMNKPKVVIIDDDQFLNFLSVDEIFWTLNDKYEIKVVWDFEWWLEEIAAEWSKDCFFLLDNSINWQDRGVDLVLEAVKMWLDANKLIVVTDNEKVWKEMLAAGAWKAIKKPLWMGWKEGLAECLSSSEGEEFKRATNA